MGFEKIKRFFLQIMVACLVAAGVLSVITVLFGSFNDIFAKALATIFLVALHSLVSFGFILNNERKKTKENLEFFTNFTFVIIILSFITSLSGVWGLVGGVLVLKLYMAYFVLLFAVLHAEILAKILGKENYMDNIVYSNYLFMTIVVLMLMILIFVDDSSLLGSMFYRLLAAFGIIDATLTLSGIILHKLYLQKHPTVNSPVFTVQPGQQVPGQAPQAAEPKRGMHPLVIVLIAYLAFQFIGGIVVALIGGLGGKF